MHDLYQLAHEDPALYDAMVALAEPPRQQAGPAPARSMAQASPQPDRPQRSRVMTHAEIVKAFMQ